MYNATEREALRAFEAAAEAGRVEYRADTLRTRSDDESGGGSSG
jgi:hypothetical protein